ncbi:MAG TPA: IPExxxVDY family protein [Cytophagales bacterium]|mgnify:CR=1 FL=1|jgi:hypothetical protein|nr:IPExxxVDY family protein [Cytophagales bacterium]
MSKNKLTYEIDFDFKLFGLISYAKDYKLAWLINEHLGINLVKDDDLKIHFVKNHHILVSNFKFETEHSIFRLLKNKAVEFSNPKKTFLLPELPDFDYFMIVQGFDASFQKGEIKKQLSAIKEIQLLNVFKPENLTSKENLIL